MAPEIFSARKLLEDRKRLSLDAAAFYLLANDRQVNQFTTAYKLGMLCKTPEDELALQGIAQVLSNIPLLLLGMQAWRVQNPNQLMILRIYTVVPTSFLNPCEKLNLCASMGPMCVLGRGRSDAIPSAFGYSGGMLATLHSDCSFDGVPFSQLMKNPKKGFFVAGVGFAQTTAEIAFQVAAGGLLAFTVAAISGPLVAGLAGFGVALGSLYIPAGTTLKYTLSAVGGRIGANLAEMRNIRPTVQWFAVPGQLALKLITAYDIYRALETVPLVKTTPTETFPHRALESVPPVKTTPTKTVPESVASAQAAILKSVAEKSVTLARQPSMVIGGKVTPIIRVTDKDAVTGTSAKKQPASTLVKELAVIPEVVESTRPDSVGEVTKPIVPAPVVCKSDLPADVAPKMPEGSKQTGLLAVKPAITSCTQAREESEVKVKDGGAVESKEWSVEEDGNVTDTPTLPAYRTNLSTPEPFALRTRIFKKKMEAPRLPPRKERKGAAVLKQVADAKKEPAAGGDEQGEQNPKTRSQSTDVRYFSDSDDTLNLPPLEKPNVPGCSRGGARQAFDAMKLKMKKLTRGKDKGKGRAVIVE